MVAPCVVRRLFLIALSDEFHARFWRGTLSGNTHTRYAFNSCLRRYLPGYRPFMYSSAAWCALTGQQRRPRPASTANPTSPQRRAGLWSADGDTTMQSLTGLDATFLYLETPEMPMHVGSFNLCELPAGHKGSFHKAVAKHMALRMHLAPVLSPPAVGQG